MLSFVLPPNGVVLSTNSLGPGSQGMYVNLAGPVDQIGEEELLEGSTGFELFYGGSWIATDYWLVLQEEADHPIVLFSNGPNDSVGCPWRTTAALTWTVGGIPVHPSSGIVGPEDLLLSAKIAGKELLTDLLKDR